MTLGWWDLGLVCGAFATGTMLVHRLQSSHATRQGQGGASAAVATTPRPATQLPVRGPDQLVEITRTKDLMRSIERRTRFSSSVFNRDCMPALEALAEFVQMLPASEAHHHAQPGGLWIHLLEVADAALTMRAGLELPQGATTEERKHLEHRWTYAVLIAALLHDVGKPVTDVKVMLFNADPRAGRPWAPLAGSMRAAGAHWYSVAFADAAARDYQAHQKLAAMLLHQFVPSRLMRWLSEDGDVLSQLLAFLAGEAPDGTLADIVKRADSDSVRRNLLHGPRTRFSTARTRPLIERLMEALRRMLLEGTHLPLNRPGAAGWVHDGCLWFVCARLADEVRSYLAQHESLQGVPGRDKNDRLFDTWQEHGACMPSADGGAVWRVRVECEAWRSPDILTVLCFPLERLYPRPEDYPAAMNGRIVAERPTRSGGGDGPAPATDAARSCPSAVPTSVNPDPVAAHAPAVSVTSAAAGASLEPPSLPPTEPDAIAQPSTALPVTPAVDPCPDQHQLEPAQVVPSEAVPLAHQTPEAVLQPAKPRPSEDDDGVLSLGESAALVERAVAAPALPPSAAVTTLGPPMRPHQPGQPPKSKKGPTPAAEAFMAWVAHSVGSGELKYNEEGALVHFVQQGCLLLSPEIFRRFLDVHRELTEGPVAVLRASHGEKAFSRLQNELAKSGWTQRNGDENLHYAAFVKADGSLSRKASFYLVPKPHLFWNPVPAPNDRIKVLPTPKKLALPKPGGVH
ncbi:TraI domain-containing protein [Ideonella sp. 4Y11]|uniref:TraI domain-containing protein n=1 Tax=Ideonella aquatica TaxID=2824119 RepID=A0A940YSR3_9BURK|nr:MobH family relaxase [Ideonella aquatica]MBQ0961771.1 TraI domain-containing protein [Ideonella aquatica]